MRRQLIRSNVNPLRFPTLFFAGRSVLTLRNPKTGGHITVKVSQAKDKQDRKKKLPIFFVKLSLLGDGQSGYVFGGTVFQNTMTCKMNNAQGEQATRVMQWIMQALGNPQVLRDNNVSLQHEGRCCRCGLPLTHPESINTAFGPDCLKIVLAQTELKIEDFEWTGVSGQS